jgi:hypothetical protein
MEELHRQCARATKRSSTAQTPYQRVLADSGVQEEVKTDLAGLTLLGSTRSSIPPRFARPPRLQGPAADARQGQTPADPTTGQTTTGFAGIYS